MEALSQNPNLRLFNGAIETAMRAAVLLCEAYPEGYGVQRLVIMDYLLVHSDDLPDGPTGLHPKTPHRGSELLVRRTALEQGLALLESRELAERRFNPEGVTFAATEATATFIDALSTEYAVKLKERSRWLINILADKSEGELVQLVSTNLGKWGAEFVTESVLYEEDPAWR